MSADLVPLTDFVSVLVPGTPESKLSIKSFVESKELEFAKGSGFYQLSKPETIQLNKDILVQRLSEPSVLITGKTVREVLKIDKNKNKSGKFMIDDEILKEFKIFIQSTSYNRNLFGGTTFLYKKEPFLSGTSSSVSTPVRVAASSGDTDVRPPKIPRLASATPQPGPSVSATTTGTGSSNLITTGTSNAGASTQIEVVISFDSTTSMYPCLSTVRQVIKDTLNKLTTHIPTIRIGIVAHGDYDTPAYIIQASNNYKFCGKDQLEHLIDFVMNVEITSGGATWPECYEYALREIRNKFDWSPDANKSLIMIGDSTPNERNHNPHDIDWREEARSLKAKGIRVYAVQALGIKSSESFYRELAKITMGFHLELHQFSSIADFLTAVCFHEDDSVNAAGTSGHLTRYEEELTSAGRMVRNLRQLFDQLQGRVVTSTNDVTTGNADSNSALVPISPSRFQVLTVDADQPIKQFAEARGLVFKAGRGFYQFTKPEAVSDKKEIVLMDKTTGDFYTGWTAAREFSGIEPGKAAIKQKPKESDKYLVFIQSTSYNRKLIAGQQFLYEVDSNL